MITNEAKHAHKVLSAQNLHDWPAASASIKAMGPFHSKPPARR
jgi:hypothetical protein